MNTKLTRTPSSASNRKTFTISLWFKIGKHPFTDGAGGDSREIIGQTSSSYFRCMIQSAGTIRCYNESGVNLVTNRKFLDKSAWYHLVIRADTTQSTADDRFRIYINGVDERTVGGYSTDTKPSLNADLAWNVTAVHQIGGHSNNYDYFSGVLSDIINIDGQSLAPTSFGETDTDTGEWRIKDLTSTSFTWGTNGFMILHNGNTITDQSSNSNNFALASGTLTKTEDNPSNNFATLNPLDNYYANATFSNGNTKITTGTSREASVTATIPMFKGKYYWEAKTLSSSAPFLGIQPIPSFGNTASPAPLQLNGYGLLSTGKVETTNGSGGSIVLATYATYTAGDIIGIAVDLDSAQNKIYFYKNGSILGASGVNITSVGSTSQGMYLVAFGVIAGQDTIEVNFGNGYFGTTAVSSAGTNASGNGIFEYDVPTGYTALSTKGLNL
jgi:hypothetical protein